MSVLFLFMGAIGIGFLLIFLIAVSSPKPPPVDLRRESGNSPLVQLDSEQLGRVVSAILDKMGLELERVTGGANEILEIRANNPTPITGGSFLVHCLTPRPETGKVDGPMVGRFIRAVRSAYVSKGLLFTNGTFTPDGRLAAEDAPVELFDREELGRLLEQYFARDAGTTMPEMLGKLLDPPRARD